MPFEGRKLSFLREFHCMHRFQPQKKKKKKKEDNYNALDSNYKGRETFQ